MDWANQPDPFRRFSGARMVELPLVPDDGTPSYDSLFQSKENPTRPLTAQSLGLFLELSLGLTAWKEFQGTRWALRSNPSSGNLHPTEGYAVLHHLLACLSDCAGVYHYAPREHALASYWAGKASRLGPDRVSNRPNDGSIPYGVNYHEIGSQKELDMIVAVREAHERNYLIFCLARATHDIEAAEQ